MQIKLIKSAFYNEGLTKKKLCKFIQETEQLSIGKYCNLFEESFAKRQWRKYWVFFNSGSSANLALIQWLLNLNILKKWDKIGFSSLTWATNVMPLIQLWLIPVPIDVELDTLNVSLKTFQSVVEQNKIKALFITNLLWFCDNIDEIEEYCKKNNLLLLEDNCESMGTEYQWKKLGNYSYASTFSTYVWHHMSTIEWWLICTDDKELYSMLKMVRAHWRDRNLPQELQEEIRDKYDMQDPFYSRYTFYTLWYNLRPNEITGFLGCEQLQYLDEIIQKREINFMRFVDVLNQNSDFYGLKYNHIEKISNFAVPVVCKSKEILQEYISKFAEKWIEIRPIVWWDITEQIFWKNLYWTNTHKTNAQLIHKQGFYFGNSPEYTEEEITLILSLLSNG